MTSTAVNQESKQEHEDNTTPTNNKYYLRIIVEHVRDNRIKDAIDVALKAINQFPQSTKHVERKCTTKIMDRDHRGVFIDNGEQHQVSKFLSHNDSNGQLLHLASAKKSFLTVYSNQPNHCYFTNNTSMKLPKSIQRKQDIVSVSCGANIVMVLTSDGIVHTSGTSKEIEYSSTKHTEKFIQISAGAIHCAMVSESGNLYTWGNSQNGKLGHGIDSGNNLERKPKLVEYFNKNVMKVSCGNFHTAVVTLDGKLYTFGRNHRGQLGYNDIEIEFDCNKGYDTYCPCTSRATEAKKHIVLPPSTFSQDFSRFFNNTRFADIQLTTPEDTIIYLHAAVLYNQHLPHLNKVLAELVSLGGDAIHMHDFLKRVYIARYKSTESETNTCFEKMGYHKLTTVDFLMTIRPFYFNRDMVFNGPSTCINDIIGTNNNYERSSIRMDELYNNSLFSDVTLTTRDGQPSIHAHRVVLAARSLYYDALLSFGPNQQTPVPDGRGGIGLVQFLYEDVYKCTHKTTGDELLSIIELADIHHIPRLHVSAQEIVSKNVDASNQLDLLKFSLLHNANFLTASIVYEMRYSNDSSAFKELKSTLTTADPSLISLSYRYFHHGLTQGQYTPRMVTDIDTIVDVEAGEKLTVALTSQEKVIQIGRGSDKNSTSLVREMPIDGVVRISAGSSHAAILTDDDQAFGWGVGFLGQVGERPTFYKDPIQICPDQQFNRVACGSHSTHLWYTGKGDPLLAAKIDNQELPQPLSPNDITWEWIQSHDDRDITIEVYANTCTPPVTAIKSDGYSDTSSFELVQSDSNQDRLTTLTVHSSVLPKQLLVSGETTIRAYRVSPEAVKLVILYLYAPTVQVILPGDLFMDVLTLATQWRLDHLHSQIYRTLKSMMTPELAVTLIIQTPASSVFNQYLTRYIRNNLSQCSKLCEFVKLPSFIKKAAKKYYI
eukprot:gene5696-6580_t